MRILQSPYTHRANFFKDNKKIKFVTCSKVSILCQNITPHSILLETLSLQSPQALLKVKISFSVFFVLSAHNENELKVYKCIQRIWGKYLSVYGEYGEFRIVCSTQNHLWMRREYLTLFGEYAERIYAYMEKTQRGSWCILLQRQETQKREISQLIMVQHERFFISLFSIQGGWD